MSQATMLSNKTLATFENHQGMNSVEIHGLLTGFLCSGRFFSETDLYQQTSFFLGETYELTDMQKHEIVACYRDTFRILESIDLAFHPLIPSADGSAISARAKALSEWCGGFLSGLGLSGFQISDVQDEVTKDALERLVDIVHVDYNDVNENGEDERYFDDIIEFTRVVAMMLFSENTLGKVALPDENLH